MRAPKKTKARGTLGCCEPGLSGADWWALRVSNS